SLFVLFRNVFWGGAENPFRVGKNNFSMKKNYLKRILKMGVTLFLTAGATTNGIAQIDVIVGAGSNTGTTTNSAANDAGPMYCTGGASSFVFSKHHMVYTAAELAAAGLPNNVIIT